LIFFAYLGFEGIVNIAGETKNPEKIIPKALLLSILITTCLYVLVAVSSVSLADWRSLGGTNAPLAFAASKALGENAYTVISIIALFATSNSVLISLVVVSRIIYGMANEGAFPRILSRLNSKTRTPPLAILLTMFCSIAFIFLGDLELVASLTSFGAFVTFAFVNSSLIYMRYRKAELDRAFKVPLNIGRFPITGFLGLLSCLFMISSFDPIVILSGTPLLFTGFILYKLSKNTR
jgi:APA family basic amino acid/polyamine antiporter